MASPRFNSISFPLLCALAYAGGVVGYLPLLTLLLPIQVAGIAGAQRYGVLAMVLAVGAVVAGGANILFGWLSDRSRRAGGGRRRWIAAGLVATLASFVALPMARTPAAVVIVIAAFQLAINALLAPLMALFAEEVPAARIGTTTGLFAAAPPIASLVSLVLAVPALASDAARLAVVGAVVMAGVLPLLLVGPGSGGTTAAAGEAPPRRDLAVAWTARLLVQIAGSVLFADLLYLTEEPAIGGQAAIARIGSLMIVANIAPLPVAALLGRWSDRLGRRTPFLFAVAALAAVGLTVMAMAPGWTARAAGFLLFSIGWNAFLPLQVGFILQLLPDPDHRGRDLGIVNLANTLPVLIGQALAWWMATPRHAGLLLMTLAALTLAGGLAMLGVREVRRTPGSR